MTLDELKRVAEAAKVAVEEDVSDERIDAFVEAYPPALCAALVDMAAAGRAVNYVKTEETFDKIAFAHIAIMALLGEANSKGGGDGEED